jgi:hypothetical protein
LDSGFERPWWFFLISSAWARLPHCQNAELAEAAALVSVYLGPTQVESDSAKNSVSNLKCNHVSKSAVAGTVKDIKVLCNSFLD